MSQIESPADWTNSILDVLTRQHRLIDELAALADQQSALIAAGETQPLLQLLTERQRIIQEFTESQKQLSELSHDIQRRLPELPDDDRQQIQSLIDSIGDRLNGVMQSDERDQQALESSRSTARRDLHAVDHGRTARDAYVNAYAANTNRFADRTG